MENSTHFCENCGSPLEAGASFCEACGAPVKSAGEMPPTPPARQPVSRAPVQPAPLQNQAGRRPAAPPPPPPGYYQPPAPPRPVYYPPPAPPRRKTPAGLIVGGVILGLVVCCGLVALVALLLGGASLWNQISGADQNFPPAIVVPYSGDGFIGLDFHWLNRQNYYQAAIKDGKFLVRKKINGQFINLTRGWVSSNSIQSGPNKIAVIMHGAVMQLKVNDDVMAQLKDNSLAFGAVALTAGVLPEAPDGTNFEGRFNNFHVLWYVQQ